MSTKKPLPVAAADALRAGTEALLRGDLIGAHRLLERAHDLDPFCTQTCFNLAVTERLRGRLSPALHHANAAALLSPGSVAAHTHLGVLRQMNGDAKRAADAYERALACDAGDRAANLAYGSLLRHSGRNVDAVARFERAVATGPREFPLMLRERALGLLRDARAAAAISAPTPIAVCSVQVVTEVMTEQGMQSLAAESEHVPPALRASADLATDAARSSREVTPEEAAQMVHEARRIVVLTGAGASVEAGLATRKDLWRRFDKDEAVSAVRAGESLFTLWSVVRDFLGDNSHAPGLTHAVLARLPRVKGIITQNVDDLHQRADTEASAGRPARCPVIELHGTLERTRCASCGAIGASCWETLQRRNESWPPTCTSCRATALRPDVVLFGEWVPPSRLAAAVTLASECDLLVIVGCAMDVAPASELPRVAARVGAKVLEVKRNASRISDAVGARLLRGPSAEVLPAMYRALEKLEAVPAFDASEAPAPRAPVAMKPLRQFYMYRAEGPQNEGTIARWLVKVGDRVAIDQPLVEIDTDKVTVEIASPSSGTIYSTYAGEGVTVVGGTALGEIEALSADAASPRRDARAAAYEDTGRHDLRDYGERTGEVRALLRTLRSARWLAPDAEFSSLNSDTRAWVEGRVDEHLAALAHFDPAGEPPASLAVWLTRDPWEALARWSTAWGIDPRAKPQRGAALAVTREIPAAAARWVAAMNAALEHIAGRYRDDTAVQSAWLALSPHVVGLRANSPFAWAGPRDAPERLAEYALAAIVARGEALPSCPVSPLLQLWLRGGWPFVLPDAVALYVPPAPLRRPTPNEITAAGRMPGLPWVSGALNNLFPALLMPPNPGHYAPLSP